RLGSPAAAAMQTTSAPMLAVSFMNRSAASRASRGVWPARGCSFAQLATEEFDLGLVALEHASEQQHALREAVREAGMRVGGSPHERLGFGVRYPGRKLGRVSQKLHE